MNATRLARYEYKYAITPELAQTILAFIKPYCLMDDNAVGNKDASYTVTSLYFDSDSYQLYWDTKNNVPTRAKLRVRTYGESGFTLAKIEVKRRIRDLVLKSSVAVPYQGWDRWLAQTNAEMFFKLGASEREAYNAFIILARNLNARPKVLVRYRRQAFRSAVNDYVRLTLDTHVVCQPMNSFDLTGRPNCWTAIDDQQSLGAAAAHLLELKFCNAPPSWIVDLVRKCGLIPQGYSKYACAVCRSILDRDVHWDLAPVLRPASAEDRWIF